MFGETKEVALLGVNDLDVLAIGKDDLVLCGVVEDMTEWQDWHDEEGTDVVEQKERKKNGTNECECEASNFYFFLFCSRCNAG